MDRSFKRAEQQIVECENDLSAHLIFDALEASLVRDQVELMKKEAAEALTKDLCLKHNLNQECKHEALYTLDKLKGVIQFLKKDRSSWQESSKRDAESTREETQFYHDTESADLSKQKKRDDKSQRK